MAAKESKSEKPTSKRLSDARKKGDVPRSTELNNSLVLFVALMFFALFFPYMGGSILDSMKQYLNNAAEFDVNFPVVSSIYTNSLNLYIKLLVPIFVLIISVIVIISIAQAGGFMIISENLKVRFDKFNIIKGLKKVMFSVNALFELLKSIVKIIVIGTIAYFAVRSDLDTIVDLPRFSVAEIVEKMGMIFFKLTFSIIIFLLILSVIDYIWQRYQYMKKLKMTKDEVKDEFKQMEGDPKIKGKRKQKQFDMAMSRMMAEVPKADVIITNPTHYAVALVYKFKQMESPKLVAKGKNLVAQRIREIAKEHDIPIVENPPVARNIYSTVEVNTFIPSELFKPVAEILAYIYKLKGKKVG